MRLAKLIIPKKINVLWRLSTPKRIMRLSFIFLLFVSISPAFSQDNSPYTRYGLGDIVPSTNINSRGMGGISAGFTDGYPFLAPLSINFNNPATYGHFQAVTEGRSKKLAYGRAILDLGMNLENRTLIDPTKTTDFTASNLLFSHLQVGVPLKKNWGLSFGLRPITRISYNLSKRERLFDPNTGQPIDSAVTLNQGDGGSYLASVGVGHRIEISDRQSFSLGANGGYLFGKKDYSARRLFINDTVEYNSGNFQTKTTYGSLYFNLGLQYQAQLDSNTFFTFGAFGNIKQSLNASQDIIRETFFYDASGGTSRIDSVYENRDVKGKIEYPSSLTVGFTIQRIPQNKKPGWLIGVDYSRTKWEDYRFYGQADSVQNKSEVRIGAELRPSLSSARKSYFGNVAYRAGVFFGPDYVKIKEKLPVFGATFGLGLPLRNYNRQSPGQATMINLAFEYIKRGNNDNLLKENMFRISLGFSLSDFWFVRKKYE
ncbi:MAG: hypothetical protein H7Y42_05535 [Chitinophagaceae bacterium]|nr:hypothetical protein [Chitinophagaceae bacterium]